MPPSKKFNSGSRLGVIFIDFMVFIFLFFMSLLTLSSLSNTPEPTHSLATQEGGIIWHVYIAFLLYFIKDIFGSASLGKRGLNVVLVDAKTGRKASPLQTVIRNATLFLWPIEFIVALISPSRRLGDFIARTKLVVNKHVFPGRQPIGRLLIPVAIVLGAVLAWGAESPLRSSIRPSKNYPLPTEASKNTATSNQLGSALIEELFEDVQSVNVAVYDETSQPGTKLVSIIVYVYSDFFYLFDDEIKKHFTDKIEAKLQAAKLGNYEARIQYAFVDGGDVDRKEFSLTGQ